MTAGAIPVAQVLASVGLLAALIAIAWVDLRQFRVPDILSLPLLAAGLAVVVVRPDVPLGDRLAGAVAGFAVFAGIGAWYFRQRGVEGLGLGDAKLLAAGGAWLGWQALPWVVLVAAVGALAATRLRPAARRGDPVAFAPWIAVGIMALWIRGPWH
jgi:leader peptidase (prepilin peptidase)/N-methyltransferase